MIIVIDNYDSFTYNLVQYLAEFGVEVHIYRNDAITPAECLAQHPSHIVISPGPGNPSDAGVSCDVINKLGSQIPILGVCLGHQCIGAVYGGKIAQAPRLMHGKTSPVLHNGEGVFRGLPNPFQAMRYHSLTVQEPLPSDLLPTAHTPEGELMGLRHWIFPTHGVQFHPESILTQCGKQLLRNFLSIRPEVINL